MNKENAHLFLPLVQALANGKTIQMRDESMNEDMCWEDLNPSDIFFRANPEEYRIKPEPRTFEMWLTPSGSMHTADHKTVVRRGWERITVQEIIE